MNRDRTFVVIMAALMVLSAFAAPGLVAADDNENGDGDESSGLAIEVTQESDLVTIEVTENGSTIEGAHVNATVTDENDSTWAEDETDADGQITGTAPNETVEVEFVATHENDSATTTVTIQGVEEDAEEAEADNLSIDVTQNGDVLVTVTENASGVENASVEVSTVDENASYVGEGSYETGENGTLSLEPPATESVDVEFVATHENDSVETTAVLEPEEQSFGSIVSAFVQSAMGNTDEPLGHSVASFVTDHNPGNAPDHAGPPDHPGPPTDDGADDESDDETEVEDEDEENEPGPPSHANSNGNN